MRLVTTALVVLTLTVASLGSPPPAAATQPQAPAAQDACYDYQATGTKARETVGYIAMSQGGSTLTGQASTLGVSSAGSAWSPAGTTTAPMVVVADTQTRNRVATVVVKLASLLTSSARLMLEKETTGGLDTSHPAETVGLLAFQRGMIYGRKL